MTKKSNVIELKPKPKLVNYTIRLPEELLKRIRKQAKKADCGINTAIWAMLEKMTSGVENGSK